MHVLHYTVKNVINKLKCDQLFYQQAQMYKLFKNTRQTSKQTSVQNKTTCGLAY